MRMQPETIHLGTHQWQVRPLTLAQVQAIEPLLFGSPEAGTVAAAVAILRVALARDHAKAATRLESVEAGAPEIAEAMAQVLRLGGFLPSGAASGEGQAEEDGTG
jgi:hypothetical protein